MEPVRVIVQGALGRVGREVVSAVRREPDMCLVGATELKASGDSLSVPGFPERIPFSENLEQMITDCQPGVVVDFSTAAATMTAVHTCTRHGVKMVIGTTGLTPDNIAEIKQLAGENKVGIVIAPNFALGAVLMMHLARIAAKYFDHAEVIELHHHLKADAPSGTALATARGMAAARNRPFSRPPGEGETPQSRGKTVEGVSIHSVRLPGLMAHQEVIFGAAGQTLSIRHDTINRECYVPGVLLAIREVVKRQEFIFGLDTLLNL